MARPKVGVRVPRPTDPSRTDPLPGAEGQQVTATVLRPFTGSVINENPSRNPSIFSIIQDLQNRPHAPTTQRPAVQVKTEQDCSPALGDQLPLPTPISVTISSTVPGAEGLQVTASAMWPNTRLPKEEHGFSPREQTTLIDETHRETQRTLPEEREQNRSSPKPRAERIQLSLEDLVSDSHMRLKDKAAKLQVSITLFKNRRKAAGLGRWPGRRVRAEIKWAQA